MPLLRPSTRHKIARYQPLVLVMLAVAAGMTLDRYCLAQIFGGAWWGLCASCLAIWWLAWRWRHDTTAAWLLLASTALAGAAWHHWNWYEYDEWEIAQVCRARSRAGVHHSDRLRIARAYVGAASHAAACDSGERAQPAGRRSDGHSRRPRMAPGQRRLPARG